MICFLHITDCAVSPKNIIKTLETLKKEGGFSFTLLREPHLHDMVLSIEATAPQTKSELTVAVIPCLKGSCSFLPLSDLKQAS